MKRTKQPRKVWIKEYLMQLFQADEKEIYRLFGPYYDARDIHSYIKKHGYRMPPDGRTKEGRAYKAGLQAGQRIAARDHTCPIILPDNEQPC